MKTEMKIMDRMKLPGGSRLLVASQCGEFLVVDRQFREITRLETFDTEDQARLDFVAANYHLARPYAGHGVRHAHAH